MAESLFNKVVELRPATLLKKDSDTSVFCGFCEISKNTFNYRTPPVSASVVRENNFTYTKNMQEIGKDVY